MPPKNPVVFFKKINLGLFDFEEHLKNPDPNLLYWILRFFKTGSDIYVILSKDEFNHYRLSKKYGDYLLLQAIKVINDESQKNMVFCQKTITFLKFKACYTHNSYSQEVLCLPHLS